MTEVVARTRDPAVDTIRKNLQRFREEAGLDQAQAAVLAKVSVDNLRRWESKGGIKTIALRKLADVYKRPVEHFYAPSPPPLANPPRYRIAFMQIDDDLPEDLQREIEELMSRANTVTRAAKKKKS